MDELQIESRSGEDCYAKVGAAYLKLANVARGLGFVQMKNGVEYVKWERVSSYLEELGFSPEVGKDSFIPENIFYRLAMKAKNETAERFQAKVADEIIPSIRKHGAYMTADTLEKALSSPDFLIQLATKLKEEKERNAALLEDVSRMKPKEVFADAVSTSKASILVGELAKILKQNGYETGEKRLFTQLREQKYLISRRGTDYNMPTQKSMELGLFEIKETAITHADGHTTVSKTTKVTGKGQQYFINKFLARD